jgi:hypothetical protein
MARHILKDSERAKKKSLSETEKTVKYTLYLTESQKIKAVKLGQKWFRKVIEEN